MCTSTTRAALSASTRPSSPPPACQMSAGTSRCVSVDSFPGVHVSYNSYYEVVKA